MFSRKEVQVIFILTMVVLLGSGVYFAAYSHFSKAEPIATDDFSDFNTLMEGSGEDLGYIVEDEQVDPNSVINDYQLYEREYNLEEALSLADVLGHQFQKNIFIIGGSTLYEQTIPYITKAYITVLDVSYYNKIQLTDDKKFVYYPYEKLIDSGFKLIETKPLKSTNYFYRITTNILEKIE